MSVYQNINGTLARMDASDLVQIAAVDTEGILGGTPGATTNGQTLVDQLAADDVQAQTDIGQIKTDLSDQQDEIEAILNVYGAKNFAKTKGQTNTDKGVTYTANADGTYTPSNTAASGGNSWYNIWISGYTIPAGSYYIGDASGAGFVDGHRNSIRLSDNTYVTPNTVVTLTDSLQIVEWSLGVANGTTAEQRDFKPVIIDSRILDRSFTTPAMTNRELTDMSTVIPVADSEFSVLATGVSISNNWSCRYGKLLNISLTIAFSSAINAFTNILEMPNYYLGNGKTGTTAMTICAKTGTGSQMPIAFDVPAGAGSIKIRNSSNISANETIIITGMVIIK